MFRKLIGTLSTALCLQGGTAAAAADYKIVTANEKGTYFAIGADLARFVAPEATVNLEVLPTAGSAANIKHLRYDPGVKFAIVQADVYQAFFYAFAYAAETDRRHLARAVILYPRSTEGSDVALRVETHAGSTSARIQALGVDIDGALAAIAGGAVTPASVPSIARLRRVFRDVVADVSGEEAWRLASSA